MAEPNGEHMESSSMVSQYGSIKPGLRCCNRRFRLDLDDFPFCGLCTFLVDAFVLVVGVVLLLAVEDGECTSTATVDTLVIWWLTHAIIGMLTNVVLLLYGCQRKLSARGYSTAILAVLVLHLVNDIAQVGCTSAAESRLHTPCTLATL